MGAGNEGVAEPGRVAAIVAGVLRVAPEAVAAESRLSDLAPLDSLTLVEIASALDDAFDVRVPGEELQGKLTIAELARVVAASPSRLA